MLGLFIDANIYLRFYNEQATAHAELLPALGSLKEHLFLTQQIANEVRRNRVRVARASLTDYKDKLSKVKNITLPPHLFSGNRKTSRQWNEELKNSIDGLHERFKDAAAEWLRKVERAEDPASLTFESLFAGARIPSPSHIEAAKRRKELGNPPGKKNDPIGDELTWEQLLAEYNGNETVWIISADEDYMEEFEGQLFLNSFLMQELQARTHNAQPVVRLFRSLPDALESYKAEVKKAKVQLPSREVMNKVRVEEYNFLEALRPVQELQRWINEAVRMPQEQLNEALRPVQELQKQINEAMRILPKKK